MYRSSGEETERLQAFYFVRMREHDRRSAAHDTLECGNVLLGYRHLLHVRLLVVRRLRTATLPLNVHSVSGRHADQATSSEKCANCGRALNWSTDISIHSSETRSPIRSPQ